MAAIIIIAIIIIFIIIGKHKAEEERKQRRRAELCELRDKAHRLAYTYPSAFYDKFQKLHHSLTEDELDSLKYISEESLKTKERDINSKIDIRFYDEWHKEQEDFNSQCIATAKSTLTGWGRYYYDVGQTHKLPNGKEHDCEVDVWNMFSYSVCRDTRLDYSLGFSQLERVKAVESILSGRYALLESYWDPILDYLSKLHENYKDIIIVFATNGIDQSRSDINDDLYKYLKEQIEQLYPYVNIDDIDDCTEFHSSKQIIVIEFSSCNDRMIDNCKQIIKARRNPKCKSSSVASIIPSATDRASLTSGIGLNKYHYCSHPGYKERLCLVPVISYISIYKEHSTEEMKALIAKKRKEIEDEIKAAEEQRRKELEECRKAQEQLRKEQECIRKENEEKERKCTAPTRLQNAVSSWYIPSAANLRCYSMYYYYPTTCDFEASQYDWDIRNMIWDFKANPHKPMSIETIMRLHKDAVREIVDDMEKCLNHFFGEDTKYLTLVCVPSSQAVINQRRYEDFAQLMCSRTQMENGYSHIRLTTDGEAKHMGGTNVAKYEINAEFFKGKNIILFDDVITSGRSMEQLRIKLQNSGANVIGGLSIGRTKHDKQQSHPIDEIGKLLNTNIYDLNDLPF